MYFSENFLLCHDEEFPSFKMMNGMRPEANFLDISPCGRLQETRTIDQGAD